MRSIITTTVLTLAIVGPFAYLAAKDAIFVKQSLQEQEETAKTLNVKYEEVNVQLDQTLETKQKSQEEVQKLEDEKKKFEEERKKLEAELNN